MDALWQVTNSLQQLVSLTQQWIHRIPPRRVYTTIGVLSLTTVFISIRSFKKIKSNTIILAGLSGSGKTVLFYKLRDGSSHQGTATSMSINEGTFVLHSESIKKSKLRPVHLVDIPGNSCFRSIPDAYLLQAAGLIFVVDALQFLPNCHGAAEFLYDILTKASIAKRKIPVLVLCNKTDKVTAHTKEFVRKQLEREILRNGNSQLEGDEPWILPSEELANDKLCAPRTAIAAVDVASDHMLTATGETFTFLGCPNEVIVAEGSGLTGEISEVENFIREHVN